MNRRVFLAGILFIAILGLNGVVFSASVPDYGGRIVEAHQAEPILLNPILIVDKPSYDVCSLIYSSLFRWNDDGELEPDLVEKYVLSSSELTIYLKKNVKWQDGTPLTAWDVKFTIDEIMNPANASALASDLSIIDRVEVVSDYVLKFYLKKPTPVILSKLTFGILPRKFWSGERLRDSDLNRSPIGSGPYIFSVWKSGQYIKLYANPRYYGGEPYITKYYYAIIPDQTVAYFKFLKGEVDVAYLKNEDFEQLKNRLKTEPEYCHLAECLDQGYDYLGFNLRNPLLSDVRIRKAIAMAINVDEVIKTIYGGYADRATGPFIVGSKWLDPDVKGYRFNPEGAKRLLQEAGFVDRDGDGIREGKNGSLRFELILNQGNWRRYMTAVLLQRQLAKVGIDVQIRMLEWGVFVDFVKKGRFDMVLAGWELTPEPDDIYSIWHSSCIPDGSGMGGNNFLAYMNPEVDKLLEEGRYEMDESKRVQIYREIHKILVNDVPCVFLISPHKLIAVSSRIRGIKVGRYGVRGSLAKWYIPQHLQVR